MPQRMPGPPAQPDLENDDNELHPIEVAEFFDDDHYFDEWHRKNLRRRGKDGRTDHCKGVLDSLPLSEVAHRLEEAFRQLKLLGLDVTNLVYYVTRLQGQPEDTAKIKYARTALLSCDEFPLLLRKWRNGRDRVHNKGYTTSGARNALDEFSVENVNLLINKEMRALAPTLHAPIGELTEEKLLDINLQDLETKMMEKAPTLWSILHNASSTPKQLESLSYKTHSAPIVMMIGICEYRRSQRRSLLQQLNAIYFKAEGLAARAHDTTHLYGLTMSHSWTYSLVDKLADNARKRAKELIQQYVFCASHDNLNLGFKVYEQRTNNQSKFDSGTAGTIYVFKDPSVTWPDREAFEAHRATSCEDTISAKDIWDLEDEAKDRLRERAIHRILKFLTDALPFDFDTYEFKDSEAFLPPPPVDQLPAGPENEVEQCMMDTITIESASQEGTRKCLDEFMRQMGLSGPEEIIKDKEIFRRLLVWIGDQLTTSRVRSIKKDRSEDFNFLQRLDYLIERFGWFHAQLAQETSIHKQYYSTHKRFGLEHGFDILKRKGLHSTSVKGAFHHGMQEALLHIAMAHFRDLWCVVGKVSRLEDLRSRTPDELKALAAIIVDEYASEDALVDYRTKPADQQDKVFEHGMLFCRDVLDYLELDDAMRTGDVGRMVDMLPRLLFRFNGGGSSHYAIEILEVLQGMLKEWTPELRSFIIHHCWLAKCHGKKEEFLAFDMIQEHNIRDIKHLFAAQGPYASWDYIKRISPSIPAQRRIKDHIEQEFNHFRRGKKHTTPAWEKDVANLQEAYRIGNAHRCRPNRKGQAKSSPEDFIGIGSSQEKLRGLVERWKTRRVTQKSTQEEYGEQDSATAGKAPQEMSGTPDAEISHETQEGDAFISAEDEISAMLEAMTV